MAYESIPLSEDIHIEKLYTVHYFEYRSDFSYPGERHNFWEFQCVDKGSAKVQTDDNVHILNRGQVIFHRPNEFHNLTAVGQTAPNIVVISFACTSPCMEFFEKRILTLSDTERNLIGMIIAEAGKCIASPLNDPYLQKMEIKKDSLFGSQQLILLYLQELLISMIRRYTLPQISTPVNRLPAPKNGSDIYKDYFLSGGTYPGICYDRRHLSRQSHWTLPASEAFQRTAPVWDHRIFYRYEGRICKTAYPGKSVEFYTDLRFPGLFFHSLLFPPVQKSNGNDAV